jgi:hypothetical protein
MIERIAVLKNQITEIAVQQEPQPTEPWNGLEISGFVDVLSNHQSSAEDKVDFGLGQAEVDLASELYERAAIEVAIAYNNETGNFELGAAIIDFHLFEGEGSHARPEFGIDHSSIIVGQFDVPFGIDYAVYASADRKMITAPRVVDITHGGWNDLGLQFALETTHGSIVAYAVNGFESSTEVLDEVASLAAGVDVFEEIDTSPANAFGTRIGIAPFSALEFGSSFAAGWNASGHSEMTLVGADLQFSMFNLELKGEFIYHSLNRSIAEENNRGYYIQSLYQLFDRVFVVGRYGSFKPDGADWIGQMSGGAGYALTDGLELRFESLINENSDNNQNLLQIVAGF